MKGMVDIKVLMKQCEHLDCTTEIPGHHQSSYCGKHDHGDRIQPASGKHVTVENDSESEGNSF